VGHDSQQGGGEGRGNDGGCGWVSACHDAARRGEKEGKKRDATRRRVRGCIILLYKHTKRQQYSYKCLHDYNSAPIQVCVTIIILLYKSTKHGNEYGTGKIKSLLSLQGRKEGEKRGHDSQEVRD